MHQSVRPVVANHRYFGFLTSKSSESFEELEHIGVDFMSAGFSRPELHFAIVYPEQIRRDTILPKKQNRTKRL